MQTNGILILVDKVLASNEKEIIKAINIKIKDYKYLIFT